MAKTSHEIERDFIKGMKASTGKDLEQWLSIIRSTAPEKRNDAVDWLKSVHGFGHMNASLLIGIHLNGGKPVYGDSGSLLDGQFSKNEDMRPLYEKLCAFIAKTDPDALMVVKKTYVSVTRKREYAAINIRKGELRLGLDLGEAPFSAGVEKSKLTGPMPRISHMITVRSGSDMNEKLAKLLSTANQRVNG